MVDAVFSVRILQAPELGLSLEGQGYVVLQNRSLEYPEAQLRVKLATCMDEERETNFWRQRAGAYEGKHC